MTFFEKINKKKVSFFLLKIKIRLEVALKASDLRRGRYKIADSGVLKFKRFKGEKRKDKRYINGYNS